MLINLLALIIKTMEDNLRYRNECMRNSNGAYNTNGCIVGEPAKPCYYKKP